MEDYIEDYKYNNCFWKKSGVLYNHARAKFSEYLSVGAMFKALAKGIRVLCETINNIPSLYKPSENKKCTRGDGILIIIECFQILNDEFRKFGKHIESLTKKIIEKNDAFQSKREAVKMCDDYNNIYQKELEKLSKTKNAYFDSLNKTIEYYLNHKFSNKLKNNKVINELENKKKIINIKKMEYKKQIEKVETARVEYMDLQGNIFASEEELERDCTNELKSYFKKFIINITNFIKNFNLPQEKYDIIEKINGELDNKCFAEENKSLITGPKRNLYREYVQDMNYYADNFEVIKSKLKGKSEKEIREINYKINKEINEFLKGIIIEEPDQINLRIEEIAKKIKENKLSQKDFLYLDKQFRTKFEEFKKWKEEKVSDQDYRKVGKEWDDRYCYMYTFLGYFNKIRVQKKELDKTNFEYLCNAIKIILELNENEDIDYNLCDLIVILSSTFYTLEPKIKSGKKYIYEVIKECSIMQKQGFWVGLTRFELNEEIQKQNEIEDTLKENDISETKINNSINAKLMSVSFNIIQFVMDSSLFNRILYDIFKYCKINDENKAAVVEMIESQLESDNTNNLKLDKEYLLSNPKANILEENLGNVKTVENNEENA